MPRTTAATGSSAGRIHRSRSGAGSARVRRSIAVPGAHHARLLGSLKLAARQRRGLTLAVLAIVAGAAIVGVVDASGRLATGRPIWIGLAAGLELVSALGFVAVFQLIFAEWLPGWMSVRMGLAVLAATILVPGGGLVAIGLGARALRTRGMPRANTGSRAIAFLVITNAPNLMVLGTLGLALGTGLLNGPHAAILTIVPAAIALSAVGLTVLLPTISHRRVALPPSRSHRRFVFAAARQLELGVIEARSLLAGRSWKLLGAGAYYAADNAVLWATFRAFGRAHPPIAIFAMAYLVGSAVSSLPVPAGIGVVEGGMIGALVLYGAPAACAAIAVVTYRAVSSGLPLTLGGVALLRLYRPLPPLSALSRSNTNASPPPGHDPAAMPEQT
jgi:uncharacterized membrane protein YbhN (UPF0104 family)